MQSSRGWLGLALVAVLAAGRPGAAPQDKGKDEKFDPAKLVGTWKYVSAVKNGEKVDEANLKKQTTIVTKDLFTLKSDEATFVMKYELDAKKSPVTVKFTITESPFGAGATAAGIIELTGDELKVCYSPMGEPPPTKFEAKEGSKHHLMILKRSK